MLALALATVDPDGRRLDLARSLQRQGLAGEAEAEVARVRAIPDLKDRQAVWRHAQRLGLNAQP